MSRFDAAISPAAKQRPNRVTAVAMIQQGALVSFRLPDSAPRSPLPTPYLVPLFRPTLGLDWLLSKMNEIYFVYKMGFL